MPPVATPEEQLRRALVDLQAANRDFVRAYGRPEKAEAAARQADEARVQAARWGALARAAERLDEDARR